MSSTIAPTPVFRFGPFELDPSSRRLFKEGIRVALSEPESQMLLTLIGRAGHVVPRRALEEAAWGRAAISDSSLRQAIYRLRKKLAASPDGPPYIEGVSSGGYRFTAPVHRAERYDAAMPSDAELAPYREFIEGRASLHTLNREGIRRALAAFESIVQRYPNYWPAHVGLANACAGQ